VSSPSVEPSSSSVKASKQAVVASVTNDKSYDHRVVVQKQSSVEVGDEVVSMRDQSQMKTSSSSQSRTKPRRPLVPDEDGPKPADTTYLSASGASHMDVMREKVAKMPEGEQKDRMQKKLQQMEERVKARKPS